MFSARYCRDCKVAVPNNIPIPTHPQDPQNLKKFPSEIECLCSKSQYIIALKVKKNVDIAGKI